MQNLMFSWLDYCVFVFLLGASLVIGLYFGFFSKQDNKNEYLFGGKQMGYFPVAVSLLASFLSGITFLGIPTEAYLHGTAMAAGAIASIVLGFMVTHIFLPIFFKLQLSCTNEYLELRFSKEVRKLSSVVYLVGLLAITSVIIYVPALAFSQVTNYSVHAITPILTIICITYTSIGGVKAVIWTDTFQFIFTLIGTFTVLIVGVTTVGGISKVWNIASEGNRTQTFDMDLSPFKRNTFWAIQSNTLISSIGRFACGQKFIQKCLSVKKLEHANRAVWIMVFGWTFILITCLFTGLTMYARYHDCDPLKAHLVDRSDQTLVHFVLDVAGHIPGIPAIFLVGLVSSSLSTMSACLNTLAGVIYDDFIDRLLPESNNRESRAATIMKVTVVLVGLLSVALVFILERLGTIIEIMLTICSILDAPMSTVFMLGMLMPFVGKKGALVGGYSSLVFMTWLVVGSQWHVYNDRLKFDHLPTSIEGCDFLNGTTPASTLPPPLNPSDEPFFLFRITMFHFTTIGTFVGITIGILTSYFSNETDTSNVNPDHIAPFLRRFLPEKKYVEVPLKDITSTNRPSAEYITEKL